MCAIAGILKFDGSGPSQKLLEQMANIMAHRGPDDQGVFVQGPVGFSHRRLSIIDVSKAGHQPMQDDSGRFCLTYNGEVYNFQELKNDLIQRGCTFRSNTDSEVILNGLREYGPDFVNRLTGMFAIAYWDSIRQELILIRDRLGVKPLDYYIDNKQLIFSSEIKGILAAGIRTELEDSQVPAFFALRYSPGEKTLFKNIRKLQPGTMMRVQKTGVVSTTAYWKLEDYNDLLPLTERQAQDQFLELFEKSVRGCMVGDVPVGAFLSGGIDSAAVCALMAKHSTQLETFTFGMGAEIDEIEDAREIARFLKINNSSISIDPRDYKYLPKALWHLEEPIGDSIIVATYRLAEAAAKKVKVIQLGEGADEILGGYIHQFVMTFGSALKENLPKTVRTAIASIFRTLPTALWDNQWLYPSRLGRSGLERAVRFFESEDDLAKSYLDLAGVFSSQQLIDLFSHDYFESVVNKNQPDGIFREFLEKTNTREFQNRLLQLDLKFWNTDQGMLRMDKLTMAHSIEARVPYLDHHLVEFCLRLPRSYKTKINQQKCLLRESASRNHLLPANVTGKKKRSFYLPSESCFGDGYAEFVKDTVSTSIKRGSTIFNKAALKKFLDCTPSELLESKQLMTFLCFEIWQQLFLNQDKNMNSTMSNAVSSQKVSI
ncbi:MAG: asparagine synthase (glutamine-hydrolyzing) [Oligoflexia bacterium]|nr:asparagine synthase (glutamine-hydrolyzing) [Oligoflexia bacterium]